MDVARLQESGYRIPLLLMAFPIGLGTALYHFGIRLAAPFVPKARQWVDGRKGSWARLEAKSTMLQGCLWMHCASVGEFEQGRPVLEAIKKERPDLPVLLTFFSPSGYEARMSFPLATHVEYLPPDSAANALRLLDLVRPKAAIFIKYEFWYQHLHALKTASVPTFLVSAIFRPSQPFFRWYGAAHRAMLACFSHLFVQDEGSRELLKKIGVNHVTVSGDTRFDRVNGIAAKNEPITIAHAFKASSSQALIVAGSTWPKDEEMLRRALDGMNIRAMVVPHELGDAHLKELTASFAGAVWWSDLEHLVATDPIEQAPAPFAGRTLLVDRMGYLSRLYKYADITYVGGGFGTGIHNTLEAAAWGKPVIFGPNYQRFAEAPGLIKAGAGYSVKDAEELRSVLTRFLTDPVALKNASDAASRYVIEHTGATQRVVRMMLATL